MKVCIISQIWELNSLAKRINAYNLLYQELLFEPRRGKDDLKKKTSKNGFYFLNSFFFP